MVPVTARTRFRRGSQEPMLILVLRVIEQAAQDYRKGPRRGGKHFATALAFFRSPLYRLMLEYVSLYVPDFDPDTVIYPEGVEV